MKNKAFITGLTIISTILMAGCTIPAVNQIPNSEQVESTSIATEEDIRDVEKESELEDNGEAIDNESAEGIDYLLDEELCEEVDTVKLDRELVVDGFKYVIPGEYSIGNDEKAGMFEFIDGVFQMIIKTKPQDYEAVKDDFDALVAKAEAAGATDVSKLNTQTIDGTEYSYYSMNLDGKKCR